jgi:molybdate transport system substrate-binding protein
MKSNSAAIGMFKLALALFAVQATIATIATAAEVKVLSTIGVRSVLMELGPQFERTSGHKLAISFDVANALKRRIDAGETYDVAILTVPVMDDLIKQSKIVVDTRVIVARGGMGLAVRVGAPKRDIGSTEAFKRVLLGAQSIAYPKEGLTGIHFAKVLERLEIATAMAPKTTLTGAGSPAELVTRGEVEMAAHIIPELLAVQGVQLLGPFPAELQIYIVLPGGVSASAMQPQAARELLQFLTAPAVVPVLRSKGYEPG